MYIVINSAIIIYNAIVMWWVNYRMIHWYRWWSKSFRASATKYFQWQKIIVNSNLSINKSVHLQMINKMCTWRTTQAGLKMASEWKLRVTSTIKITLCLLHNADLTSFQQSKHSLFNCDDDRWYLPVNIYDYPHSKYNTSVKVHCVNCTLTMHMVLRLQTGQMKQMKKCMMKKQKLQTRKWKITKKYITAKIVGRKNKWLNVQVKITISTKIKLKQSQMRLSRQWDGKGEEAQEQQAKHLYLDQM